MSAATPTPFLEVRSLRKTFGDHTVLEEINLTVTKGTVLTILGKSGTGKSVLLKCLAGVIPPSVGEVFFEGKSFAADDHKARDAFRKRCSYLFQSNALLDSLTAWENVALPLEQTTLLPKPEIRKRVREALARLDLESSSKMFPGQMSGGMQKRLALARAIVTQPELVLFDEPTAGLDPIRRNAVFEMIARYQREFGFTAVIVTHDLPEALVVSDQVALLDRGRIRFQGTPDEFASSDEPNVMAFRDTTNALKNQITALRSGAKSNQENVA